MLSNGIKHKELLIKQHMQPPARLTVMQQQHLACNLAAIQVALPWVSVMWYPHA
jgi:hypothetical protein